MLATVLLISSSFLLVGALKNLPDFLLPCQNDQNLSSCSRQALEDLRPYLTKGIPELLVPPMEPLFVPKMTRIQRNSNIANYHINMTNLVFFGLGDFKVIDAVVDPNNLAFRLKLGFPRLEYSCDAGAEGVIVNFVISGAGSVLVDYTNVVFDIILNGELFTRAEGDFIEWKREDVEISYDAVQFTHVNGFFDDPTITHIFKVAMNRSMRLLGTSMRSPIEFCIGNFIVETLNAVHKSYPKDVLYPVP